MAIHEELSSSNYLEIESPNKRGKRVKVRSVITITAPSDFSSSQLSTDDSRASSKSFGSLDDGETSSKTFGSSDDDETSSKSFDSINEKINLSWAIERYTESMFEKINNTLGEKKVDWETLRSTTYKVQDSFHQHLMMRQKRESFPSSILRSRNTFWSSKTKSTTKKNVRWRDEEIAKKKKLMDTRDEIYRNNLTGETDLVEIIGRDDKRINSSCCGNRDKQLQESKEDSETVFGRIFLSFTDQDPLISLCERKTLLHYECRHKCTGSEAEVDEYEGELNSLVLEEEILPSFHASKLEKHNQVDPNFNKNNRVNQEKNVMPLASTRSFDFTQIRKKELSPPRSQSAGRERASKSSNTITLQHRMSVPSKETSKKEDKDTRKSNSPSQNHNKNVSSALQRTVEEKDPQQLKDLAETISSTSTERIQTIERKGTKPLQRMSPLRRKLFSTRSLKAGGIASERKQSKASRRPHYRIKCQNKKQNDSGDKHKREFDNGDHDNYFEYDEQLLLSPRMNKSYDTRSLENSCIVNSGVMVYQ